MTEFKGKFPNSTAGGRPANANSPARKSLPLARSIRLTTPQPARNPDPTTKATSLAYLLFERPDLDRAEKFLKDFGLRPVGRSPDEIFFRGVGAAPYIYVALRGPKARFLGLAFTVASLDDLTKLAALPEASAVEDVDWPGGGKRVRLTDPAGFRVDAVWGQSPVEPLPHRNPIKMNAPDALIRVDGTQRPPQAPPEITRLGHILLEVANYQEVCAWYTGHFGLIPSDIAVLPNGEPAATFFRLDLGETPADHHTLAMTIHFQSGYGHSAYEVVDADAVGAGQRVLQRNGYRHSWGIGRHILGSQIFDYWEDPWGDKHEHYCDGDVFTSEFPTEVHLVSREAMAQWGPPLPKRFTQPRINFAALKALVRNVRAYDDLSVKKLFTLLKLIG